MKGLSKYLYTKLYTILEILLSLNSIMLHETKSVCPSKLKYRKYADETT